MAVPSQVPVRYPNGVSSDYPWGPLGNFGLPHPFSYHFWEDDFDALLGAAGIYTKTASGNGTVAHAAGDGGTLLFTTNSSTPLVTDVASIQLPAASFSYTAGKKMFFLARLQLADAVNAAFNVGLIQTTATPMTVTDGVYFNKATGSAANLTLFADSASAHVGTLVIPTGAYTLANATYIDMGFYIDRQGYISAFVGANLVNQPANNFPAGQVKGPVGRVLPTSYTAANLNLTMALNSGTASSKTMTADFIMAAKER